MRSQDDFDSVVRQARLVVEGGGSLEAAVGYMRDAGLSQIECVKAVKAITGRNLGEAKDLVHFSAAWSDMRPHQEQLHKALSDGLDQEGQD